MAEHMTPVVAKVLPEEKAAFAAATQLVGTTPSNAIRMFIAAFNRCGTFPFDISPNGAFDAPPDSHQQRLFQTAGTLGRTFSARR